MNTAPTERELCDLIAHEARLLDSGCFDEWLSLFAATGRYWVPLRGAAQAEGEAHNAIADEDRLLLALRVERLKNPRAHSLHPRPRCQHVLQQPMLCSRDDAAARWELQTPFLYIESRGERQLMLAGTLRHRLVHTDGRLQIELKRIDLLNPDAAWPAIQLFP